MRTWVDNEGCTGCGLCAQIAPKVYVMDGDDGLAYAYDKDGVKVGPEGIVDVPEGTEDKAVEAMLECPTEVIWLEDEHGSGSFRNA
jgi:ferredoxin